MKPAINREKKVYYTGGGRGKFVGEKTGRVYWFPEGQSILVDELDIPGLLRYTRLTGCCGRPKRLTAPFEIVE